MSGSDPEDGKTDRINRRAMLRGTVAAGFAAAGMIGTASATETKTLTIQALGELAEYRVTVSGEITKELNGSPGGEDRIVNDGQTVVGTVAGRGEDRFAVTGEIVSVEFEEGNAKVLANGEVIESSTRTDSDHGKESHRTSGYVLAQGDTCVPVEPITGDLSVEEFYEYQLPEQHVSGDNGASASDTEVYMSAGTKNLQRPQTSIAFLYRGVEGLSLVFVHGSPESPDGGAVTFRLSGLPAGGNWIVNDDLYDAASNYDRWSIDGTEHRIDWTWAGGGTDGGVFRGLGDDFDVVIRPAFNEAAALFGEYYEGTVTDWEFLSGSAAGPERVSLSLDEDVRIKTGSCGGDAA